MKREIHIIFLIGVVLAGAGCTALQRNEPGFQDRKLTEWLKDYALFSYWTSELDENGMLIEWSPPITKEEREMGERAQKALQQIGTNAIPTLLRMLASTERSNSDLAAAGFHALGQAASPAVPTLIAMLETNHVVACSALEAIGPAAAEATPALLKQASLTNGAEAFLTLRALGQIHGMPELVVPFLRDQLESCSKDTTIAYAAALYIRALAGYGEQAKEAIPDIQPFLTAQQEDVRASATNALQQINNDNNTRAR